jgi:hypothetical protein
MLVAAAVCPHPPLLVPAVAAGAAGEAGAGAAREVADLRAACLDAVRHLYEVAPDRVVVVGAGREAGAWDERAGGSLAGFGVPVAAGGPEVVLPLSLTIGAWLLDEVARQVAVGAELGAVRAEQGAVRRYVAVPDDATPEACARIGAELVAGPDRTALLVMGDGSAKRTASSPGYLDARALDVDQAMAAALTKPDPDALLGLAPDLAEELWIAGRPAWQVLAGAARAAYSEQPGIRIDARSAYDDAPFGVGYFVVEWRLETRA